MEMEAEADNTIDTENVKEPETVAKSCKPGAPDRILDRVTNFVPREKVEELNDVPLELAVETIHDEDYWKRTALKKWPTICKDSNKTWRKTYLETHLNQFLEEFHPWSGDLKELEVLVTLLRHDISSVSLTQLIPICYGIPAKPVEDLPQGADLEVAKGADADLDDGIRELSMEMETHTRSLATPPVEKEDIAKTGKAKAIKLNLPTDDYGHGHGEEEQDEEAEDGKLAPPARYDSSHLDLYLVLPKLETLVKVSIIYDLQEIGLDWEERLATFTDRDCINLAKALAASPLIEIFELNKSHMTGEQCKTLVREGLIKMPHLKILNLAYNRIGNVGAKALARLLIDKEACAPRTLHTLKLCRNEIRNRGAKALAFALSINSYLTELDLRLNFIKNAGGEDFGHSLAENNSLQVLWLGGNRLGTDACYVLGKMLMINETLIYLDVSSNALEVKGGEFLAVGMRNNKTVLKLDVRLSKIGFQSESDVMVQLKKNRSKLDYSLIDKEDYYPPEFEQEIPVDDMEDMGSEEEEEEDEEEEVQVLKSAKSKNHVDQTSSESDV